VSKKNPGSFTCGNSACAARREIALNPHCASRTRNPSPTRSNRLYVRLISSRFQPRVVRDSGSKRDPTATSARPSATVPITRASWISSCNSWMRRG